MYEMYYLFISGRATRRILRREDAIRMSAEIVREHPTLTVEISEDGKLPFFETYMTDHGIVSKGWDNSKKLEIQIADLKDSISHCHPRETKRLERALKIAQDAEREQRRIYHDGVLKFIGREKND